MEINRWIKRQAGGLIVLGFLLWLLRSFSFSSQQRSAFLCANGEKFLAMCICELGYEGKSCDYKVSVPEKARPPCVWDPLTNPFCLALPAFGRIRYQNLTMWKEKVQIGELDFWRKNAVPNQNVLQTDAFSMFKDVPTFLGDVLEIGCGPYTKLRLIMEQRQKLGKPITVSSAFLQDPMIDIYLKEAADCSYRDGKFCVKGYDCIKQIWRTGALAEELTAREQFDTVIMMNVLEHTLDSILILTNIFNALRYNGVLIFWERYHADHDTMFGDVYTREPLHPLSFTKYFFREHLHTTYEVIKTVDYVEPSNKVRFIGFIGRKIHKNGL